jgi:hypothetical protein
VLATSKKAGRKGRGRSSSSMMAWGGPSPLACVRKKFYSRRPLSVAAELVTLSRRGGQRLFAPSRIDVRRKKGLDRCPDPGCFSVPAYCASPRSRAVVAEAVNGAESLHPAHAVIRTLISLHQPIRSLPQSSPIRVAILTTANNRSSKGLFSPRIHHQPVLLRCQHLGHRTAHPR